MREESGVGAQAMRLAPPRVKNAEEEALRQAPARCATHC